MMTILDSYNLVIINIIMMYIDESIIDVELHSNHMDKTKDSNDNEILKHMNKSISH
jgi:hypothetical protein